MRLLLLQTGNECLCMCMCKGVLLVLVRLFLLLRLVPAVATWMQKSTKGYRRKKPGTATARKDSALLVMSGSLTFSLQALLVRHEQYMADAEQERVEMSVKIEDGAELVSRH